MKKDIITNLCLSIGSILCFFILIETGLRITRLQTVKPNPPRIFRVSEHPDISYELIPSLKHEKAYKAKISTNSLGFRGPEIDESRPTAVIFGDSIAFGYGVNDEETLAAHLGNLMQGYNVMNTAAPGYNLKQETGILREKVLHLDLEIAVLVFHFNDLDSTTGFLDDNGVLRPKGWEPSQESCQPITGPMKYIPGNCWLSDHSAFYKAFKRAYDLQASKKRKSNEQMESIGNPDDDSVKQEYLNLYSVQLSEFGSLIPHTRKCFVIWPDNELHEPSRARLKKIAENLGFEVIDLYETFGNKVPTLPWDTVHPSPGALKKAAGVIAERLE